MNKVKILEEGKMSIYHYDFYNYHTLNLVMIYI